MSAGDFMSAKNNKAKLDAKGAVAKKRHGLSKWEKIAIPLIIIIAVWAVYSFIQPPTTGGTSSLTNSVSTTISQSNAAPDFTLPVVCSSPTNCANNPSSGLTGQSLTLSAFKGKVVLLEFMEPWCPHCQNMAPIMASLYSQYGKANVVFISVAGPWNGATAADAANFIVKYGSGWTYVYDSSGTIFNNYGVNSTPTFYILGTDGAVSTSLTGEQSQDALSGALSTAGAT
jgi:thiol-disulfide isomerase/thioredoxin